MSNMSAFEIRLELLKMAKDLLIEDYYGQRNVVDQNWTQSVELAKQNGTESPSHPGYGPFPTEEQVINKATALNNFVSQTPVEVKPTKK